MLEVKIQCVCGHHYKFQVEPLNGRMPSVVNCPVCGSDGTARANAAIQQAQTNPAAGNFTKTMQEKQKTSPSTGFNLNLGDIYHVLFRHKWKIIAVWTLGLIVAAALYVMWPVPYSSEAALFVRYVKDNRDINSTGPDNNVVGTTSTADSVMNAEIEMLQSLDVAKEAAEILGPEIITKLNGGTNSYTAAAIIRKNLQIEIGTRSPVIHVFFKQADPEIVQAVLTQVIQSYFKKHQEAHQVGSTDENLTMTTDQLKSQLAQTGKELREMKNQVGVTQLTETKKLNAEKLAKITEDLWAAETELAEHQALINSFTGTNVASVKTDTNTPAESVQAPDDKVREYQNLCTTLESLQKKKTDLLEIYTEKTPRVRTVQVLIDTNQKNKKQLEAEYPQLTAYRIATPSSPGQPGTPTLDMFVEKNRILSLNTKIARLNDHLKETREQIDKISTVEEKIRDLERRRDTQEANLTAYERKSFDSNIEEQLNGGKMSNIKIIQKPTPACPDPAKRNKIAGAVLAVSLALGLALAFVIEFYFDRSFKRPVEIEAKLGLPLFLSIPETGRTGRQLATRNLRLLTNGHDKGSSPPSPALNDSTEITSWKSNPAMQPFFEALRDRLITHFEIKDINHKPKLVAVTSCTAGSGVSTVASGLASSLSETGEGNVLLVDMNTEKGAAHFFHKGKLACGLDEVLDKKSSRENAQVEKNLFVVSESTAEEKLPRILHKRFSALIPKLHASDFDYIIFDMPPVSQTSATTRVARFMDMVFMVVEAEKTDRDIVKRASKMLAEAKAVNVGVVLNKSHNYVPRQLNQEL